MKELNKDIKILLLKVLRNNQATIEQAETISKFFTPEAFKRTEPTPKEVAEFFKELGIVRDC